MILPVMNVGVVLKYRLLNYQNVFVIPWIFFERIRDDKKVLKMIKSLMIIVVIGDAFKFISPSSFSHLGSKISFIVWALLLLGGIFISFVFIYILKYFFEKNLLVSISNDCFKVWRGDKCKRVIFFNSIQHIEFRTCDIFVHYQENRIPKVLTLSEPEDDLKREVLTIKEKYSV